MDVKKYMSKHFIVRLSLLLVLVCAAALFDMYHASNQKLADSVRNLPVHDESGDSKTFYCNQIPTFNLKTSPSEFSSRFRFAFSQDKFLLKYYNLRMFQLLKAESLISSFPVVCSFRALPFNRDIYESPDDTPPLL